VRPVEIAVDAQHVVADQQRDLRVPYLVEGTEARHHAPRAVASEPRHPELRNSAGILRERKRAVVILDQLHPSGIEVLDEPGLAECRAHAENRVVLGSLVRDVFAVRRSVGLVPVLPRLVRQRRATAQRLGKYLVLWHIAKRPIDLSG